MCLILEYGNVSMVICTVMRNLTSGLTGFRMLGGKLDLFWAVLGPPTLLPVGILCPVAVYLVSGPSSTRLFQQLVWHHSDARRTPFVLRLPTVYQGANSARI